MEYQKIINVPGNKVNQPYKFRIKSWIDINDQSRGTYNGNSDMGFKIKMLKSSLRDYSDANILLKSKYNNYRSRS